MIINASLMPTHAKLGAPQKHNKPNITKSMPTVRTVNMACLIQIAELTTLRLYREREEQEEGGEREERGERGEREKKDGERQMEYSRQKTGRDERSRTHLSQNVQCNTQRKIIRFVTRSKEMFHVYVFYIYTTVVSTEY